MTKERAKAKFLGKEEEAFEKMREWGEEHSQVTLDEMAPELVSQR